MVAMPPRTTVRRTRNYQPTREEIVRECARIKAGWSARETETRAVCGAVNLWSVPEVQAAVARAKENYNATD